MDERSRACLSVPFDVVPRIYRSSNVAVTIRVRIMQDHKQAFGNIQRGWFRRGRRKGILTAGDLAHPD
jgi:hypothetical protein